MANVKTMQPFTYADPCVEFGPTVLCNETASIEVRKAINEFMNTSIKGK